MKKRTATPFRVLCAFALLRMDLRRPEDAVNQPDDTVRQFREVRCRRLNGPFHLQSFVTLHKIPPFP
nr:MAG TPA: hypothetical protein [Caudoviricetes sp.]